MSRPKIPVTVLTGYLGAGKTTLLNRILREEHGHRIAVVENEFGEIGVDQALVIRADEEIFEMNNGCICCTVRGDLIRVLGRLAARRDRFDRVLIETTGLADPGPVAQTFFMDDDIAEDYRLDGVVTLIDAVHHDQHIETSEEARAQVAFADVIVLNKTDLSTPRALYHLERRLRAMNSEATLLRAQHGEVPLDRVLGIGGFDLDRALRTKPTFLEPEHPFEWGGALRVGERPLTLELRPGPDPTMLALAVPLASPTEAGLAEAAERALRRWDRDAPTLAHSAGLRPEQTSRLHVEGGSRFVFPLEGFAPGDYALFTQHLPEEFGLTVRGVTGPIPIKVSRVFAAEHVHDAEISSVGLEEPRPLDLTRLNAWLGALLRERGQDIFRSKGVLDIAGQAERYVFQGVHMLMDGQVDRPWGPAEVRGSRLVFIGRRLDREALREGLRGCVA